MKSRNLFLASITTLLILNSCSKNDQSTNSKGFAGSYRGTVSDTIDGVYLQTLNDYTIVINQTNTLGQVTLTNNIIITNTGNISGLNFSIPQTIASETPSLNVIESASGVFTGTNNNTWKVTFYQDLIDPSNGSFKQRLKRACILVKQ